MKASELVLVTCDYNVIALQKSDGEVIWETLLVSKFFKPSAPFITLAVDESGVYAHTYDQLFRLDLNTGTIVWKKELDSGRWIKGQGIASIALPGSTTSASPAPQAARIQAVRAQDGGDSGAAA